MPRGPWFLNFLRRCFLRAAQLARRDLFGPFPFSSPSFGAGDMVAGRTATIIPPSDSRQHARRMAGLQAQNRKTFFIEVSSSKLAAQDDATVAGLAQQGGKVRCCPSGRSPTCVPGIGAVGDCPSSGPRLRRRQSSTNTECTLPRLQVTVETESDERLPRYAP